MLRPPHQRYKRLYVYHLDAVDLPPLTDPDLIGNWLEDDTPILFFHRKKDELVRKLCRQHGCKVIYQANLDYADWEPGQIIEPFTVGNISIAPVWDGAESDIIIDPSVVFGSGFHPSTRLCLETLSKYCRAPATTPQSMLDLGSGTGLLAITGAKLGIKNITACDNNPLACEVTAKNIALNDCANKIAIRCSNLRQEPPETRVDLVAANLPHTLLAELFNTPSFWQAKLYIVAGFRPAMEEQLLAALPPHRIKMVERRRTDSWCLWVLKPITSQAH